MGIELGVQFLWLGSVKDGRTLVGVDTRLGLVSVGGISLDILREIMLLIRYDTVRELNPRTKVLMKHLPEKVNEIFLQILIHEGTGYLNQYHLLSFVEMLKDDRLKPCIILLLGDIGLDLLK